MLAATPADWLCVLRKASRASACCTTTVPAHTLYEIVRKLADGAEVRLETEGGEQMLLTSGRSRFHLACLSPDSFPDLKSGTFSHDFTMPAAAMRELIERTQFAISNEETRYYLNGIYLHAGQSNGIKVLRAVATDGHRLARVEMALPAGACGRPSARATARWRSPLTGWFHSSTAGSITQEVTPCGTCQAAPRM
mgnify:CR=1 FL=1